MSGKYKRKVDEPAMSDVTLLLQVEDLISMAMGPPQKNVVNFKILQTVLLILARHMRMLDQKVELQLEYLEDLETDQAKQEELLRRQKEESDEDSIDEEGGEGPEEESEGKAGGKKRRKGKGGRGKEGADDETEGQKFVYEEGDSFRPHSDKGGEDGVDENERRSGKSKDASKGRDKRGDEEEAGKEDEGGSKKGKGKKLGTGENDEYDEATGGRRGKEAVKDDGDDDVSSKGRTKTKGKTDSDTTVLSSVVDTDKSSKGRGKEGVGGGKGSTGSGKKGAKGGKEAAGGGKEDMEGGKEGGASEKQGVEGGKEGAADGKKGKGAKESKGKEGGKSEGGKKGEKGKGSDINVSETMRGDEKILVVDKGKGAKKGSRELEKVVSELKDKAGPLPPPTMPDNAKLRADLAKGSASLQDTMKAMQVTARMDAAEKAVDTLSEMLTSLAANGYLPPDIASKVADMKQNVESILKGLDDDGGGAKGVGGAKGAGAVGTKGASGAGTAGSKTKKPGLSAAASEIGGPDAVGMDPSSVSKKGPGGKLATLDEAAMPGRRASEGGRASTGQSFGAPSYGAGARSGAETPIKSLGSTAKSYGGASTKSAVTERFATPQEVVIGIDNVKETLLQELKSSAGKGMALADTAFQTAKGLRESMDIVLSINKRIDSLNNMIDDYNTQLAGFDTGVRTQITSFQEQMNQMTQDLNGGLKLIQSGGNNAETAAVLELTEKHDALGHEFESMTHNHNFLTQRQARLVADLKALMEAVEGLGEQKADREEVADGLKDKADNSRLEGLLSEKIFSKVREDLELRIAVCYDKFHMQDSIWTEALKQIGEVVRGKAEHAQLLAFRDETEDNLRATHKMLQLLARILGEPKAAILNREVSRDGRCATCGHRAIMGQYAEARGAPPRLPELRAAAGPDPLTPRRVEEQKCLRELMAAADDEPPEGRRQPHVCHRWVGGSHTLVTERVTWERATQPMRMPAGVKKVVGMGSDGKNYKLEEQLLPCVECNQLSPDSEERGDKKDDGKPIISRRVTITAPYEGGEDLDEHRQERHPKSSIAQGSVMATTLLVKDQIILPKTVIVEIDHTPAREGEIGHIVEGVALVIDETTARRASVKYEVAQMKKHEADEVMGPVVPRGPTT